MVFVPDSPAYRTCCCHVRTCTIVIGVVELIGLLWQLIHMCVGYSRYGDVDAVNVNSTSFTVGFGTTPGSLAGSIAGFIIGFIVVVLLFVGVVKQRHLFLIPHLIYQIIGIIGLAVGVVLCAIAAAAIGIGSSVVASSVKDQAEANAAALGGISLTIVLVIMIVIFIIWIIFEIWFFVVVLKCYRFFRDQREAGLGPGTQMGAMHYKG